MSCFARAWAVGCGLTVASLAIGPLWAGPPSSPVSEPSNADSSAPDLPAQETMAPVAVPSAPPPPAPAPAAAKKAEELKKKVAGAYKDAFYLNDFSYLGDPGYKGSNLGEALKQIPIGDTGKLDIGGQYRLRYHHEHNMRGLGLTGRDDDFLLDRTRVYFDAKMTRRLRLFVELLDAGSSYENFAPRQIEVNPLDVQNLFADAVIVDSPDGKFTALGGRQEDHAPGVPHEDRRPWMFIVGE